MRCYGVPQGHMQMCSLGTYLWRFFTSWCIGYLSFVQWQFVCRKRGTWTALGGAFNI